MNFTTMAQSKPFKNNKLPVWKQNKIKNKAKAPKPRFRGKSKHDHYNQLDYIAGNIEPQGGEFIVSRLVDGFVRLLEGASHSDAIDAILFLTLLKESVRRGIDIHDHRIPIRDFAASGADFCQTLQPVFDCISGHLELSSELFVLTSEVQTLDDFELRRAFGHSIGKVLVLVSQWSMPNSQGGMLSTDSGIPVNVSVSSEQFKEFIGENNSENLLQRLRETVSGVGEKPFHIEHTLANPFKGFDFLGFIKENKIVIALAVLAYVGYSAVTIGGKYETAFNVVVGVASLYVLADPVLPWIQDIANCVRDELKKRNSIRPQGGIAGHMSSAMTRLALSGLLVSHWSGIKADTAGGIVSEFMNKIANMKRVNEGLGFTFDFLFQIIQDFLNWIGDVANVKKLQFKDDPFWEVSVFGEQVHVLKADYLKDPLKDSAFAGELTQLRAEGEKLRAKIATTPGSSGVIPIVSTHLKELNDLINDLNSRLVSVNGIREEPFLLLLMGKTKIGKTCFNNVLAQEITAATIDESKLTHFLEHRGEYIHLYNATDNYYSGYHGQYNLMADEFGYTKDVANGNPTIFSELIQWVNVNPMNLAMADLTSKGRVYFRSKCIWATSNRKHFNAIDSVVEKEAVYRRLDFSWIAAVKQFFSTEATMELGPWEREPDWPRIISGDASDDFSYLEFYKVTNLSQGTYDPIPVNVEELKSRILSEIRTKKNNYGDLKLKIEAGVHRALTARGYPVPQLGVTCGKCPGCDKNVFPRRDTNYRRFCSDVFDMYAESANTIKIGYHVMDKLSFIDLFLLLRVDRTLRDTIPVVECAGEARDFETFVAHFLRESEKNRAAYYFTGENTFMGNAWRVVKRVAKALMIAAPIILTLNWIRKWLFPTREEQSYTPIDGELTIQHGDYAQRKPKKKGAKVNMPQRIFFQGGQDPNAQNVITKLVTRNVWRFSITTAPGKSYTGCLLCLQNDMVLMPEHYISTWMDIVNGDEEEGLAPVVDAKITFTNCNLRNPLTKELKEHGFSRTLADLLTAYSLDGKKTMDIFKLGSTQTEDVGVCYIPGISGRKISHLIRNKNQALPTVHTGTLGLVNRDFSAVYHTAKYHTESNLSYEDGRWTVEKALVYEIPTRVGDCGCPFVIHDKSSEQKIASIHVAGVGNVQGIGIVIDRESVESAMRMCCSYNDVMYDIAEAAASPEVKPLIQGGYEVTEGEPVIECKVKPIPQAIKTKIIESPINGMIPLFPPKKKPAMLARKGNIDPLKNAMFGYGLSYNRPRLDLYRAAIDDYCSELFGTTYEITPQLRRVLTFEEAVKGLPGEEFMDAINRKTSPGWPMKHMLKGGSKQSAFGTDEFLFNTDDAVVVRNQCDYIEGMILKGYRPYILNNHFLKDELRLIDKANDGRSRLISSGDLVFSILLRKYTMTFSTFLMRTRIDNGCACGTNPYGGDWDRLARRHGNNKQNFRMIAGDHSGYDKSLAPIDIQIMKVVTLRFYQDNGTDTERIRNALIDEIAQSRHVFNGKVYSWSGGNTSGNAITTPIDTISGLVLDRYVILLNYPHRVSGYVEAMTILSTMKDFVKMNRYNDDTLMSVQTNGPFNFITQEYMAEAFAIIGMIYTDESKSVDKITTDRRLTDVTFLKRSFAQTHYMNKRKWMAPLALDTICESIQWSKDHDVGWKFWKSNVDHMLVELAAHDRDTFNVLSDQIVRACGTCKTPHSVVLPMYRDLQDKFTGLELHY